MLRISDCIRYLQMWPALGLQVLLQGQVHMSAWRASPMIACLRCYPVRASCPLMSSYVVLEAAIVCRRRSEENLQTQE